MFLPSLRVVRCERIVKGRKNVTATRKRSDSSSNHCGSLPIKRLDLQGIFNNLQANYQRERSIRHPLRALRQSISGVCKQGSESLEKRTKTVNFSEKGAQNRMAARSIRALTTLKNNRKKRRQLAACTKKHFLLAN